MLLTGSVKLNLNKKLHCNYILIIPFWWVGWGFFSLVAGICSSDRTDRSKFRALLQTVFWVWEYCLHHLFFVFYLLKLLSLLQAIILHNRFSTKLINMLKIIIWLNFTMLFFSGYNELYLKITRFKKITQIYPNA